MTAITLIKLLALRWWHVLRDAFGLFWLAPVIILVPIAAEGAQHLVEWQLGFFTSREFAQSIQDSTLRMAFGYIKVAALVFGILFAGRAYYARAQHFNWWSPRRVAWKNLSIAFALMLISSIPEMLTTGKIQMILAVGVGLATLPLTVMLVAAVMGDADMGLRRAFTQGWSAALRMTLFFISSWLPLQALHMQNHRWAFGASDWSILALMSFDSLVVGIMAATMGLSLYHGLWPLRDGLPGELPSGAQSGKERENGQI